MENKIIEDNLRQIESVISSKIVSDDKDIINEIHVVSNGHRSPKQIVRDVQSVLLATYDIDVDHKKISVAQIPDNTFATKGKRVTISGVTIERNENRSKISVNLVNSGDLFTYTITGVNTRRNNDRMLAESTLNAVQEAFGLDDAFIFEDVRTVQLSEHNIVIVLVTGILNGREQKLVGSSIEMNDHFGAVVKATLDSINRFVTK